MSQPSLESSAPQTDQPATPPYPYYADGFYGVDWIKPDYYAGILKYQETKCFHYVGTNAAQSSEAWIDTETQFPVALKKNGQLFEFERRVGPQTLTLHPAYQSAWDRFRQAQIRLDSLKGLR